MPREILNPTLIKKNLPHNFFLVTISSEIPTDSYFFIKPSYDKLPLLLKSLSTADEN